MAWPSWSDATAAWRSALWRKQVTVMSALAIVGVVGFGAAQTVVSVNEARDQVGRLQQAQVREVAQAIRFALANVERHVGAVTALPWTLSDWLTLDTRREEYGRLLRLVPAIESVSYRNAAGVELVFVSRREADRVVRTPPAVQPAARPASAAVAGFGHVAYRDDYDPVLDFEIQAPEPAAGGQTVVRISLRALALELQAPLSLQGSQVYALDASDTVVLHRDADLLLARVKRALPADAATVPAQRATGLDGGDVLRSTAAIPEVGWRIVVEQPRSVVLRPVWATLERTALFVVLSVALAVGAALYLAGRTTRPVRVLHQAAAELEAGHLEATAEIRTGDELEDLARQFNRMAASLRASVTELEDRVAQRTADLRRANDHKSAFLAHMSHELRTPLNAILGFADVLREGMAGALSDEQLEYIGDIHASGLHLLTLINDVLDLSKIEAGQLELEIDEFGVPDLVDTALALVRQRAAMKGVALEARLAPQADVWAGDARRIKQVLLNLLSNAVRFTEGGGRVTVENGVDAVDGLWFVVRDTGVGIDPADHGAVFEEFRQVGADSAARAEGTGLGLALVRRLVEQHGGRVTLASALGAGAAFRFNIPGRRA